MRGAVLLLLVSSACIAYPPPNTGAGHPVPEPSLVPKLGGPLYRVFDVDEIDSIDALYVIADIYRAVEKCTGIERDFAPVRVFLASNIMILTKEEGWADHYAGMRTRNRPWVYVKRTSDVESMAWTLKHEFVHYLTDQGHPEVDDTMRACGVHREVSV